MSSLPSPLAPILAALHASPLRIWSIIITLYGDAIVPRGGTLDLATMLRIFAAMAVGPGAVRTAVSRLAADGWLVGRKVGRASFYCLTAKGDTIFAIAAPRIYRAAPPPWDGVWRLVLLAPETAAGPARTALLDAGFAAPLPGLWIAPPGNEAVPASIAALAGVLRLDARAEGASGRRLAALAWPLARLAGGYERFVALFAPLARWLEAGGKLTGEEALVARILLVHQYRRVILHDPDLPPALLPPGWPGAAARALCRRLDAALYAPSEAWLDRHARTPKGSLPPPAARQARFRDDDRPENENHLQSQ